MIQLNPQYEAIFDSRNIDEDCNKIADEINDVARMQIKEILAVGMYKQAVTLKAASKRVKCEHIQTLPSVSRLDRRSVSNCCSRW